MDTSSSYAFKDLRELARRAEVPVYSIGLDSGRERGHVVQSPGRLPPGGGRGWFPGSRGGLPGGRGPGGGHGFPVPPQARVDGRPLQELAEETGGRADVLKDLERSGPRGDAPYGGERLKEAVETIAALLRHRYLLGYEPPDGKDGWRTIRVEVDRPAAKARARKGYYGGA
jgi:hypothetical protein